MTLGNVIAQNRKRLGLTQEGLAQRLDVTNQAVSKWETDQCCPDTMLLPKIADIFGISIDMLFGREAKAPVPTVGLPWEDDGSFHVAVFVGHELAGDCAGLASVTFSYDGPVRDLYCAMNVSCGDVAGSVTAGGEVSCGEVMGNVSSEADVSCGDVQGSVTAVGDVSCGDVAGDVRAGGDVDCGDVAGDAAAGDDVDCGDVSGNVNAGGDVSCGDVEGNVSAGGDVSCGDVEGNVSAGGDVDCGSVSGRVSSSSGEMDSDEEENIRFNVSDGAAWNKGFAAKIGRDVTIRVQGLLSDIFGSEVHFSAESAEDEPVETEPED